MRRPPARGSRRNRGEEAGSHPTSSVAFSVLHTQAMKTVLSVRTKSTKQATRLLAEKGKAAVLKVILDTKKPIHSMLPTAMNEPLKPFRVGDKGFEPLTYCV